MVNKVTLIGRLGKDPEVRTLDNGTYVARFSLATDESYKDRQGEWQTVTEWHDIILWRELAQRGERTLKKGFLVYVEGKLTYRSWKDEEGHTHNVAEIKARSFRVLQKGTQQQRPAKQTVAATTSPIASANNDLPF